MFDNLVHETSSTTGTGNFTVAAVNGKQRFSDAFGTGGTDEFFYFISNRGAGEWEQGTGHMSDANTLVRDTVQTSSNSNNAVNFSAGNKDVTNDIPAADRLIVSDFGDAAFKDTGTGAGDVAAGNHGHDNAVASTSAGFMSGDDKAKLDGIESGADVTDATSVDTAGAVMNSDYDANTILAANSDNTPAAVTVAEGRIVGRITSGNITALTASEVRTLLNVEDGADATDATNVAAAGALMQGVHEVWIDATAMTPRASNGAELVDYDSGANDQTMKVMAFDTSTQEYAHFKWGMPKGWNNGTVTFIPYWTNTGGSSTQNVVWSLSGRALGNDDAINGSQGTGQTSDDTWQAQNDLHIGPESSAITIGNTPAENDLVLFEVSRVVGSDNMTGDALLIGLKLRITIDLSNDA